MKLENSKRNSLTWVIVGATSSIAKAFAHIAASFGHALLLVARDPQELEIVASDLRIRYGVICDTYLLDFTQESSVFLTKLSSMSSEIALFIAASSQYLNDELTDKHIDSLIHMNVLNTTKLIWAFLQKEQTSHRLIYLSSVAGLRGRAKNSLYGGSKAAIDIFLQGIQQTAKHSPIITIARLGFIDTIQTYGQPGIFYASTPIICAKACWKASSKNKRILYHPSFWRFIMLIIENLPFFLFKKVK